MFNNNNTTKLYGSKTVLQIIYNAWFNSPDETQRKQVGRNSRGQDPRDNSTAYVRIKDPKKYMTSESYFNLIKYNFCI